MFWHVQGNPPAHHRFINDGVIPKHITYAYKRGVKITKNDDFYTLPEGNAKTIDLLFLMASAPVSTGAMPDGGSESYSGTTMGMERATEALSQKFPSFFDRA